MDNSSPTNFNGGVVLLSYNNFGRWFALTIVVIAVSLSGCPDYSHLRPVPDYKNNPTDYDEAPPDR